MHWLQYCIIILQIGRLQNRLQWSDLETTVSRNAYRCYLELRYSDLSPELAAPVKTS